MDVIIIIIIFVFAPVTVIDAGATDKKSTGVDLTEY